MGKCEGVGQWEKWGNKDVGEWEAVRVWKNERSEAVRVPWKDAR